VYAEICKKNHGMNMKLVRGGHGQYTEEQHKNQATNKLTLGSRTRMTHGLRQGKQSTATGSPARRWLSCRAARQRQEAPGVGKGLQNPTMKSWGTTAALYS
jgi:hypothetical protein